MASFLTQILAGVANKHITTKIAPSDSVSSTFTKLREATTRGELPKEQGGIAGHLGNLKEIAKPLAVATAVTAGAAIGAPLIATGAGKLLTKIAPKAVTQAKEQVKESVSGAITPRETALPVLKAEDPKPSAAVERAASTMIRGLRERVSKRRSEMLNVNTQREDMETPTLAATSAAPATLTAPAGEPASTAEGGGFDFKKYIPFIIVGVLLLALLMTRDKK